MIPMGPFTGAIVQRPPGCLSESAADEPASRGGVRLEERDQQVDHLLHAQLRRMGAVVLDVVARPDEAVVAPEQAVSPEIRAPAEPRSLELSAHTLRDHATYGIATVVGSRLRVETCDRIAA